MQHDREHSTREAEGMRVLLGSYLKLGAGSRLLVRWHLDEADRAGRAALADFVAVCMAERIGVCMEEIDEQSPFSHDALDRHDVVLYLSKTKSIHRKQLISCLAEPGRKAAVYRLFDFGYELFELCFRMTQDELKAVNDRILGYAKAASRIVITSDSGTSLVLRPDPRAHWASNHGHFRQPFPGVFPCGEVSTFSADVSGIFVADGAMNMSYPFAFDPRLGDRKVVLVISEGRVVGHRTEDRVIDGLCRNLFSVENADRVGEIGFGTNEGIERFVPFRSLINERVAGFHLGIGAPVKNENYPEWNCRLHTDFILASPKVYFDDVLAFSGGHWALPGDKIGQADLYADAI